MSPKAQSNLAQDHLPQIISYFQQACDKYKTPSDYLVSAGLFGQAVQSDTLTHIPTTIFCVAEVCMAAEPQRTLTFKNTSHILCTRLKSSSEIYRLIDYTINVYQYKIIYSQITFANLPQKCTLITKGKIPRPYMIVLLSPRI